MARGDALPDSDEVTRWVKPKLLGRDDDGNVVVDGKGRPRLIFPQAFELRDDEESLSVTWLQHFGATRAVHLPLAADAFRQTTDSGKLQANSAFAIAEVRRIKEAGTAHDTKLRILLDPIDGNSGHSEIRRFPRELSSLHSVLADEVFVERYLYRHVKEDGWSP